MRVRHVFSFFDQLKAFFPTLAVDDQLVGLVNNPVVQVRAMQSTLLSQTTTTKLTALEYNASEIHYRVHIRTTNRQVDFHLL